MIVSPLLKVLVSRLNSLVVDERTTSDLKDILATLETVDEVVYEAEEKQNLNGAFRNWLQSLQDVLYELDDLIDEVIRNPSDNDSRNQAPPPPPLRRLLPISKSAPQSSPLRDILSALNQIAAEGKQLVLRDDSEVVLVTRRGFETNPFLNPEGVIGRERDLKAVIDLIRKSVTEAEQTVPVVPILGSMGIGKTILAQLIYNDTSSDISGFDHKLWICPAAFEDTNHFLKLLGCQLFEDDRSQKDDDEVARQQLKMEMQDFLKSKRSLIILDDVEDNASHKSIARDLMDMLSSKKGSAIILTTRSRRVASLIGTTPAYKLQPLTLEDSYKLLASNAFPSEMEDDSEFKDIGGALAKSCCGIPLLLLMVGSFLYDKKTVKEWKRYMKAVEDRGFARLEEDGWNDFTVDLSSHLKLPFQCFRLQKACELGVEALKCVWMALGYLHNSGAKTDQPPEYIARKILKDFSDSGLCPDVQYAQGGVVQHINFNDALYEMATQSARPWWVTIRDYSQLGGSPIYIIWDQDCRNGRVLHSDHIHYPEKIRLFMVKVETRRRASLQFVNNIVSCLRHLRVLGLGKCDFELLPDSIGELRYLRYLDVGRSARMTGLPDSVCDLWFLQTLFLHGCTNLEELPANIGRLQNLRYLTLTIKKQKLPDALGELTSLRTLGLTGCPELTSLLSPIQKLKNLVTLAVVNCQELELEALNGLDALHTLLLSHLPKFTTLSLSAKLKNLQILSCKTLTEIKWISKIRSLRSLTIVDCPDLSDGASEPIDLLELVIRNCPKLRDTAWIKHFVVLRSLIIDDCPNLVSLDSGFSELKVLERLEIKGCPVLTMWFAGPQGKDWGGVVSPIFSD